MTKVFWLIEVLLFVPDIIIGGYFLFVKHPIKTFSIIAIFSSLMVITSRNTVNSVFFLILDLGLFQNAEAEFI